jgi:hypothetical protein
MANSDELAQAIGAYDDAMSRFLGQLRRAIEHNPEPTEGDCEEVLKLKKQLRLIKTMREERAVRRATLIA